MEMTPGAKISWMLHDLRVGRGCNSDELAELQQSPELSEAERAKLALLLQTWRAFQQQLQETFETFRHYDDEES